jgi:type VI secretion system protein ImpL
MLQDLEIVPLRSLPQAAQDLYVLASPKSPIKELLTAIVRQLTLSEAARAHGCGAGSSASREGCGKGHQGPGDDCRSQRRSLRHVSELLPAR